MSVQLDRAFYYPGDTVNGRVFITVTAPFGCQTMTLSAEGKEKCEWERYYYVTEHRTRRVMRDGHWRTEVYTVRVEKHKPEKKKKVAMDFKVPLMDLSSVGYQLQPGNYTATFAFQLPRKISSSFKFENKHVREKPEAKIEHKIKIKLEGTALHQPPKSKAVINVRQLPIGIDSLNKNIHNKITKYFCYSAGESKTEA